MSNHGANMEFFDPHNDQDDENQQPSSLGTINHSNIPLISDLGILLQGAQNCYTMDMGTQASNYSDVLNLLSSFGHASPVSAQKSDYIPCTVNILHDGERDECSDSRRNTEDSMGIQHSPSEEYTPAQDLKMSSECKSLKRRRSAEVHNFTERLRRQRLKDKMKALQELIPNCSKRDKASTLDEAINYIKKLQYHVEMMSMGSGFTMFRAPWTIPAAQQGMQQIPGLSSLQRDGYGLGLGIEMPGPPSANFLTNQLGLPLVSSGFMGLQGTSGMTSSGNVVDALLFTTSSTTSWVPPSSTQWETSRS